MKHFRKHHLLQILQKYEGSMRPLDALLRDYFRENRAVGSKDRKEICETLYHMVRWLGAIDHKCSRPITWEERIRVTEEFKPEFDNEEIPLHIRYSMPKGLFDLLDNSIGREKTLEFCSVSNGTAPTTIRINPTRTTRDALMDRWKEFEISKCQYSDLGIVFHKKENFFALPEFKEGLFEIQDEGSQLVADFLDIKPGDHVLDYCAGAGGKTLAFAHKLEGKGQIYLHDIRAHALAEAKKRLKRAGVQNVQIGPSLKRLKRKMDVILLDVPCSGTGTLRRNPDQKWRIDPEAVDRLIKTQKEIFEESLAYLKPGGTIVFATCSVLPQENDVSRFPVEVEKSFASFPKEGEMDGFFAAKLKVC